jgi:hypothetical protein
MELDRGRSRHGRIRWFLISLALVAVAVLAAAALRVGGVPEIEISPRLPAIGPATPVTVTVSEPSRGLRQVRIELVQGAGEGAQEGGGEGGGGEQLTLLAERSYRPRGALAFWRPATETDEISFEVGRETVRTLHEGEAILRVTAGRAGTWLRRPDPAIRELMLPVRLRPPTLSVLSSHHYLKQGGSEAVVYAVGETSVRDGVRAGDRFFPGFPLPGGRPGERFALFAAPWDLADGSAIELTAVDDVGNEARVRFLDVYTPRPYKTGRIRLTDDFMQRVVPEILAQTPEISDSGDLLKSYLRINRELRRRNRARLVEMAADSVQEFLWSEPFLQMPGSRVMSPFAVKRTYVYDGKEVDEEFHLGYDLATVRRDDVPAANAGIVRHAGYFGIYGNAVVLDHGYGLMTLYGHLSSIEVTEGERVERGRTLGRSGQTGLAGGDHLHFAVLLQGMPVDPVEWWDRQWLENRIGRKLGRASPL